MDNQAKRDIQSLREVEDFKGARFMGSFFWAIPLLLGTGSLYGLGPIFGGIILISIFALCIPYKIRKIMYFIFTVPYPFIGILGGIPGILFGLGASAIIGLLCFYNYIYIKKIEEVRTP